MTIDDARAARNPTYLQAAVPKLLPSAVFVAGQSP